MTIQRKYPCKDIVEATPRRLFKHKKTQDVSSAMSNRLMLGILFLSLFSLTLPALAEESAQNPGSVRMRELVPDVERPTKTDRTHIFSRSQWKYGLQRDDYLNQWIDRPLLIDPSLAEGGDGRLHDLTFKSFDRTIDVVKLYGLDGLAFFPETSGRTIIFEFTDKENGKGVELLTELPAAKYDTSKVDVIKLALKNPASFKIDGKLVVTSYRADALSLDAWKTMMDKFKAAVGDEFLFLPAIDKLDGKTLTYWQDKFRKGDISETDVERIKDYLRSWLRLADGLYFASSAMIKAEDRRFNEAFYRDFLIRLMKSVLAESEFSHKYFGLSALVGHENVTRLGYTHNSDGTKTLRRSMEAALDAQPELINIPEWDEQNENTSLRPTIYNGTSSMRIMRYYTAKARGQEVAPLPNDNLALPNLIVSYRKLLTLGEKLEIELLNVPDGSGEVNYTVRLVLKSPEGETAYTSDVQSFNSDKLEDRTLTIASESLAKFPVLVPHLEVTTGDKTTEISKGLHYIELRPTWNWDYKWVKQPIRDLLSPKTVQFDVSSPAEDGTRTVTAKLEVDEPLAYVEVLDNDDVVYTHSSEQAWHENAEEVIISLQWQSGEDEFLQGSIALQHAEGRWLIPSDEKVLNVKDNKLTGLFTSRKPRRVLVAIPRKDIDKAEFAIDLLNIFEGTLPVSTILKESFYGVPGPQRFNMVISRYDRPIKIPNQLRVNSVEFTTPILPDMPHSVLHLQGVGVSGKLYRSQPVRLGESNDQMVTATVYSDTAKKPVDIEVDASRIPTIRYEFDNRRGSVLFTDAGRTLSGILGDRSNLVIERGGGQTGDGTPFFLKDDYAKDAKQSAPEWVKIDDTAYSLKFDGKGTFVVLPQGVIPRRSAFTISMDIRPEHDSGREVIIANRANYQGSLSVYRDNGILKADYFSDGGKSLKDANSKLRVPAGEWSHLEIIYDQDQLRFIVNGEEGKPLKVAGPGVYDMVSVVGGFGDAWFEGEIRNLEIRHAVDKSAKKEETQ